MRRLATCLIAALAAVSALVVVPEPASAAFTTTRAAIVSFDGTAIVYNLFLPETATALDPVPLVMQTHGWGGTGATSPGGVAGRLVDEGYAVVTWDARGFGASGGEVHIDDPDWEARDASALLTAVAARPEIKKVAGDPVVGMIGGSYAGGIQLALAAHDSRIDAIAPEITWNDLCSSLFPNGVIKHTWVQALFAAGLATSTGLGLDPRNTAGIQTGNYAPFIVDDYVNGLAAGTPTQKIYDDFSGLGLAGYGATNPVAVPTLLLQGKSDTLFNLNEAARNLAHVQANGAPAKLISYCGGHAGCPAGYLDSSYGARVSDAVSAWFTKYLKGVGTTDTGPTVEYSTRDGQWHSAASFPSVDAPGAATLITASGAGTLGATGGPNITDTAMLETASSGPATLRVPVTTAGAGGLHVVGTPRATVTVSGVGPGVHLFLKLVDREDGVVLDGQAQGLRVENLGATAQTFTLDLVAVTELVRAGHTLELEITTGNLNHLNYRGAAIVDVAATVTVPTL